MSQLPPYRERQYTHYHDVEWWAQHMDADAPERFDLKSPILDLGCGTGEKAILWAGRGYAVCGLDIADYCIDWCARHRQHQEPDQVQRRVSFVQADLRDKWPFSDGSFTSVFCSDVWEHLPEEYNQHFLLEMHRILRPGLRPGGQALIIVPKAKAYRSIDHIQEFTEADVQHLADSSAFPQWEMTVAEERIHLLLVAHDQPR